MWHEQSPTPFSDAIIAFAQSRGQICTPHDAGVLLNNHIQDIIQTEAILERDAARYVLQHLAQYGPKILFPYQ